jgi:chromosomal replication initiation ATPase DnaA
MTDIRKQCMEWAINTGMKSPGDIVAAAEMFLEFLEGGDLQVAQALTVNTALCDQASQAVEDDGFSKARLIIQRVAKKYNMAPSAITGNRRNKETVAVRDEAVAAVRNECPEMSLVAMGRVFNKDHTSILASLRKTGNWRPAIVA